MESREQLKDMPRVQNENFSLSTISNLFIIQGRQRAILTVLKRHGFSDLCNTRILEMGCGNGGVLAELVFLGASPGNLFGIDLNLNRVVRAQGILPGTHFANADGSCLPFPQGAFDLVLQFTAISSVLDPDLRRAICADLIRVTRPGGLILSYDFWLNPTNPQTRGFHPTEIRQSFPDCAIEFQKITLAPPIVRKLVPISWGLAAFLENLRFLNTHYLSVIQPRAHNLD